eukprot:scaffold18102_cov69-Cylindrotheca_fusiformis.AAC.1
MSLLNNNNDSSMVIRSIQQHPAISPMQHHHDLPPSFQKGRLRPHNNNCWAERNPKDVVLVLSKLP